MNKLLIVVICFFSFAAFGKETGKINPSSSDVWGYDLSQYAPFNGGDPSIEVMLTPNNDLAFMFTSYLNIQKRKTTLIGFNFFDGNQMEIEDVNKYDKKYKLRPPGKRQDWVMFEDTTLIVHDCYGLYDVFADDLLRYCAVKKGYYKPGRFYEEKEMERYSIFSVERIVKENKLTDDYNICPLAIDFMDLESDTFIVFNRHCSLILRFDKNLETKFELQHIIDLGDGKILKRNFFILPYEKILYFYEHVVQGYEGKLTPEIAKQFLNYLYEEQEKEF